MGTNSTGRKKLLQLLSLSLREQVEGHDVLLHLRTHLLTPHWTGCCKPPAGGANGGDSAKGSSIKLFHLWSVATGSGSSGVKIEMVQECTQACVFR